MGTRPVRYRDDAGKRSRQAGAIMLMAPREQRESLSMVVLGIPVTFRAGRPECGRTSNWSMIHSARSPLQTRWTLQPGLGVRVVIADNLHKDVGSRRWSSIL